jgi:quercetin dioxygenase-like cupin family protein
MTTGDDRASTPWLLQSADQQPSWGLPKADEVGYIRARCNGMEGTGFSAAVVYMPFGQNTPVHANTGEHIIFQLDGLVEFRMQGESWPLEPLDMLFIPANVAYSYHNIGRTTASFISIIGRTDDWPPAATYYD